MRKRFHVTGACNPEKHYMVDVSARLEMIHKMIERGDYFTINRARQYGKTTLLRALKQYLSDEYAVVSLDFQMLSHTNFKDEASFVKAFSKELWITTQRNQILPMQIQDEWKMLMASKEGDLASLFLCMSEWCAISEKPVVLMIDEVDSATNNQVFLDFLAQLRAYYLNREERPTFQSVILAGVYDIKNMKRKLRDDEEHKVNSPWNIAAEFDIDMSFSVNDMIGMLAEYENDVHTGMNLEEIATLLYEYTSGYPFLVSRLCLLMDEKLEGTEEFCDKSAIWTKEGVMRAVKYLLNERNTLFESLVNKLYEYPELKQLLQTLLLKGTDIAYNSLVPSIEVAEMFGFVKNEKERVVITNRIFETVLYNLFLSEEMLESKMYAFALKEKNQFIRGGHLDMRKVLERFVETFDYLYGDQEESFVEEVGRRYFLLFLRPIINGVGNCYVEARTRKMNRMDIVVDYRGEQFVVELKIWHGKKYNEDGEQQLSEYLDFHHLKVGYLLTFSFNKNKTVGVKEVIYQDKRLIEAVV